VSGPERCSRGHAQHMDGAIEAGVITARLVDNNIVMSTQDYTTDYRAKRIWAYSILRSLCLMHKMYSSHAMHITALVRDVMTTQSAMK